MYMYIIIMLKMVLGMDCFTMGWIVVQWDGQNSNLPASGVGHNDTIVNREGVRGQSGNVPGPYLDGLAQSSTEAVITATWYLQCLNILYMYIYNT